MSLLTGLIWSYSTDTRSSLLSESLGLWTLPSAFCLISSVFFCLFGLVFRLKGVSVSVEPWPSVHVQQWVTRDLKVRAVRTYVCTRIPARRPEVTGPALPQVSLHTHPSHVARECLLGEVLKSSGRQHPGQRLPLHPPAFSQGPCCALCARYPQT